MSNPILWLLVFCAGLCVGSFLNVCISRIPRGQSIVRPGSRCPDCGTPIAFYDNIPLVSYVLLRARCRACQSPISIRYPLVELLAGVLACCVLFKYGISLSAVVYFLFISALLAVTGIDIDHRIIPDRISLAGIPAGFVASLILPGITWADSLAGILAGGGSLLAVAWGYYLFTGSEGMGGGDIKLLAMIGAFVGWKGVIFTIFVASLTGTLVGVALMAAAGKNLKFAVPFGPFLALGAGAYVFFGNAVIYWYLYGVRPW